MLIVALVGGVISGVFGAGFAAVALVHPAMVLISFPAHLPFSWRLGGLPVHHAACLCPLICFGWHICHVSLELR